MEELTREYPVLTDVPIAWGDMDAFEHVNNKVYFKHFENARIKYFEKLKFLEYMAETGIGPILSSTQCRFKIPLTYPDTVTVGARVASLGESMGEDRFIMQYAVISHQYQKIAAIGEGEIVIFDYRNNKKAPLPEEIRNRILELERSIL